MEQLGQVGVESRRVVIISQDSFYRELCEDEAEDAKVGNFDFDHPGETSDLFLFLCYHFLRLSMGLLLFVFLFPF